MAKATGDTILREFVLERLRRLDIERDYLRAFPRFELPYGQAWLCLLLSELDEAEFKMEVEARVTEWLLQRTDCMDSAQYDSWLFSYFLLRMSGTRLGGLAPDRDVISRKKYSRHDFLDLASLLAILEGHNHASRQPRPWWLTIANVHECGRAATCLWSLADDRFDAELARFPTRYWHGRFELVSHWVPQFLWVGLALHSGVIRTSG
jgi:hypothetical protein